MNLNLFSAVWSTLGLGELGNNDQGAQSTGPTSRGTNSGISVTDEKAMQISAVWTCVRLITETVGSLPLKVYQREGEDMQDRKLAPFNNPLALLLNISPNRFMTPRQFREAMTCQLVLWGNAYAVIDWNDSRTRPLSVTPLKPEAMKVVRLDGGLTYHYQTNKGLHIFDESSILHIKGFGTDGVVGLSPLSFARQTLGISASADMFASRTFANGGTPHGVLTTDKVLSQKQRKSLRSIYSGISAGAVNAGNLWVLEAGTGYTNISMNPDDMQMLDTRTFQLSEIGRYFRVPSYLMNDSQKATTWGSGIEQINLGFLQYTLDPYLTRWEEVLNLKLQTGSNRLKYFVDHNLDGLLRADSKSRAAFFATYAQNGIMSRNEIRKKENLKPVGGADQLTVQVNLTPVDQLQSIVGSEDADQSTE